MFKLHTKERNKINDNTHNNTHIIKNNNNIHLLKPTNKQTVLDYNR